jgi:ribose-phosphate pyrophosphokinase
MKKNPIIILSSDEMSDMSEYVASHLQGRTSEDCYAHVGLEYGRFPSGEISVRIPETIRSRSVYFFHSLFHPDPNTSLMKMILANNAVALASADSLVLVIPYIPYLRQDRKDQPRVPISAKVIAQLIETNTKVKRIITMDMHVDQAEGFFNIPVDNLRSKRLFADFYKKELAGDFSDFMVVAPDFGSAKRAGRFARDLGENVPVAILEKERKTGNTVVTHKLIGESPKGKHVAIYDDLIDTGNTTVASVKALRSLGAKQVDVCATHSVFSPTPESTAEEKFKQAGVRVIVTNTIPRLEAYLRQHASWLTVLPIDDLMVKVLAESEGGSVSSLF